MKFIAGDSVWFISKYGDRVTGKYVEPSTVPGIDGPVEGHTIESTNCFGSEDAPTLCFVAKGLKLCEK